MQLIQASTGFLVLRRPPAKPALLGTCFSFRHANVVLTAAHCVRGLSPESVGFAIPTGDNSDEGLPVREILCHPTADLAIVRLDFHGLRVIQSLWDYETALSWGDSFLAFGYPEDSSPGSGVMPTPRMFRGYVQRYFRHESHMGFRYLAAELSIGAPGGLSGGPICLTRDQSKVVGVVSENLESSTFLSAVEESREDGSLYRQETRSMINYGLGVVLYDVAEWLDKHVPSDPLDA